MAAPCRARGISHPAHRRARATSGLETSAAVGEKPKWRAKRTERQQAYQPWRALPRMRRLWDVTTGKHTATLQGHTDFLYSVVFSPDGRTLASGAFDGAIKLWDMPAAGKADKRTQP